MLYGIPEASTELGWDIGLPLLLALVLFALAVPIWVSLGFAAIGLLVMTDVLPLTLFGEALFSGMDTFALIAIPLFILTGDVLVRSGLSGKLLDVAEAVTHSALQRRESRGSHQRSDFPERDDEQFLKHSLAYQTDGDPRIEYSDVTITRWPPGDRVYGNN